MRAGRRPGSGRDIVVARRDPPTLFDPIEELFDQVAHDSMLSVLELESRGHDQSQHDLLSLRPGLKSAFAAKRTRQAKPVGSVENDPKETSAESGYPAITGARNCEVSERNLGLFRAFRKTARSGTGPDR
jgi:hypothetical protein